MNILHFIYLFCFKNMFFFYFSVQVPSSDSFYLSLKDKNSWKILVIKLKLYHFVSYLKLTNSAVLIFSNERHHHGRGLLLHLPPLLRRISRGRSRIRGRGRRPSRHFDLLRLNFVGPWLSPHTRDVGIVPMDFDTGGQLSLELRMLRLMSSRRWRRHHESIRRMASVPLVEQILSPGGMAFDLMTSLASLLLARFRGQFGLLVFLLRRAVVEGRDYGRSVLVLVPKVVGHAWDMGRTLRRQRWLRWFAL